MSGGWWVQPWVSIRPRPRPPEETAVNKQQTPVLMELVVLWWTACAALSKLLLWSLVLWVREGCGE